MTFDEFKKAMKNTYPDKKIQFETNGLMNQASFDNFTFYNLRYSQSVYGIMNGQEIGRCEGIENNIK